MVLGVATAIFYVAPAATAGPGGNSASGCDQASNHYGSTGPGANHSGPYDSTCNGTASVNGNGGGQANGRPCAGCVGRADNKNPHGQYPDAAGDGNNGYECDGNHGIARGNPAHTGCTLSAPTPGGGGAAVTPPPPGAGGAAVTPGGGGASVLGESMTAPGRGGAAVLGKSITAGAEGAVGAAGAAQAGALARTGLAVDVLLGVAGGLFLLAVAALLIGRRPRQVA